MAKVVKGIWPGNPSGATRAARQPCQYEAFIPDKLMDLSMAMLRSPVLAK